MGFSYIVYKSEGGGSPIVPPDDAKRCQYPRYVVDLINIIPNLGYEIAGRIYILYAAIVILQQK